MIQKPTRRDMLIGGLATTIMGTLATSVVAKGVRTPRIAPQGNGDPIVSVPPVVDASASTRFHITVTPPQSYSPGVQFTVKIVQMVYSLSGSEMVATYIDENLDGIEGGAFQTTITFPANSDPISFSAYLDPMQSQMSKNYTVIAYNASNCGSAMIQVTP